MQETLPVEPQCPHVDRCGGCAFQDRAYEAQVAAKAATLAQLWREEGVAGDDCSLAVTPSPNPYHYRTRMDYVTSKGHFGLRMRGRWNYIVDLTTCHLIPPAAFDVVQTLRLRAQELGLPDYHVRTHAGFLRYLVVRRSPQDQLLIAAVTAEGPYQEQLEDLAVLALLQPGVVGFHWLINDALTDLSFGEPRRQWGAPTLPMQVGAHTLHIGPNTFFQNNVHLLLPMLEGVSEAMFSDGQRGHVADLYGGVGLIALHMVGRAESVVLVESHQESATLAEHNVEKNGASNVTVVADDVLAFLQRQVPGYFDVMVADPPRVGMGEPVCAELLRLRPRRIVYLSCNPLTQLADIQHLSADYRVTMVQGYDMFPHTPHVEVLAVLER